MGRGEIYLRADSGAVEHVESRWQRERHTTQYILGTCQYCHTRSTMAGGGTSGGRGAWACSNERVSFLVP